MPLCQFGTVVRGRLAYGDVTEGCRCRRTPFLGSSLKPRPAHGVTAPLLVKESLQAASCLSAGQSTLRRNQLLPSASAVEAETGRVAGEGDYVKVHYTGTLDDGETFDSSRGREPLSFVVGAGEVIPGFDDAVSGLPVGGTRKERVSADRAYGPWRQELVARIPRAQLPPAAQGLVIGNMVRMGNGMTALVTEVSEEGIVIDCNPQLAGKDLTFDVELVELVKANEMETATFAAGCFWGPELAFQRVPGVVSTCVGYSQGQVEDPSYEAVCSGSTGHAEVVQVVYNSREVSYKDLLNVFWERHDPTQLNRQGNDQGTQYRSGIYVHSAEQKEAALAAKAEVQAKYQVPVVTEVEEIQNFYKAEEYHQQYLTHPRAAQTPFAAMADVGQRICTTACAHVCTTACAHVCTTACAHVCTTACATRLPAGCSSAFGM